MSEPLPMDKKSRALGQRRLNTQLLIAVCNSNKDRVISLLESGANPNARCQESLMSACHLAVYHGQNDILDVLLSAGADPTARDRKGIQPHHMAAYSYMSKYSLSCLNAILDKDSSLVDSPIKESVKSDHQIPENELDSFVHDHESVSKMAPENVTEGSTVLFIAAKRGLKEIVEELITKRHAQVNKTANGNLTPFDVIGLEETKILDCSLRNTAELQDTCGVSDTILEMLINNGGRPSENTLHSAVVSGHVQWVTDCLKTVTPHSKYENELTLLHLTVKNVKGKKEQKMEYNEILEKLLEKIPNAINLQDSEGKTPLFLAVEVVWMEGIELLLFKGADIAIPSYNGESVMHLAAKQGNCKLLKELLLISMAQIVDYVKLINARDKEGYTPLFRAVESRHYCCVEVLLGYTSRQRHLESYGGRKFSLLHLAVNATAGNDLRMMDKIVNFLITNNHDVLNETNDAGLTAVELAASLGNIKCLECLLSYREIKKHFLNSIAEANAKETALHLAAKSGHYRTVEYLLDNHQLPIDRSDRKKRSALILAALGGHEKCVYALLLRGANLADKDTITNRTAIEIIMNYVPNPLQIIEDLLNSFTGEKNRYDGTENKCSRSMPYGMGRTTLMEKDPDSFNILLEPPKNHERNNPDSLNFEVLLNYKCLVAGTREMVVIEAVRDCEFVQLHQLFFLHPLVKSFLILKWKRVDFIFAVLSYLYIFHVSSVTGLALLVRGEQFSPIAWICRAGIWISIIPIIIVEVLNGILEGNIHCEAEIHAKWLSIGTAGMLSVVPQLWWGPYLASVTVLLAWMQLLLFYAMSPKWGLYILMFFEVVKNVFQVVSTFVFLIVGFALSFYILFNGHPPFHDLWSSLCEALAMMLSLGYNDIFNKEYADTGPFRFFGRIMYLGFQFLVIMVLTNIVLGMSVRDVTELEGKSKLLSMQGSFLSLVDKFCYNKQLLSWLPRQCQNRLTKYYHPKLKQLRVYPNRRTSKHNPLEKDILHEIMTTITGRKAHSEHINQLEKEVRCIKTKVDEIYQEVRAIYEIVGGKT